MRSSGEEGHQGRRMKFQWLSLIGLLGFLIFILLFGFLITNL